MSVEFSIIIPTYNSRNTIEKLLDSLERQTYRNFEIVVVDDNSTDDTHVMLSKYAIRAFGLKENKGAANARNYGARHAQGNILLFLDSDVILYEDAMERFHGRFKSGDVKVLIGMYAAEPANRGFCQEFKAMQEHVWYSNIPPDNATPFTPSIGAIKKDLFLSVGGFDTKYCDADVEDYEFTLKLGRTNRIYIDKNIRARHHFPGFVKLVGSYARRCFLWTEIFLDQRKFDTNGTTAGQGFLSILYTASVLSFVLSLWAAVFAVFGAAFLSAAFYIDRGFLGFVYRKKGFSFLLSAILLKIFLASIVVSAAISGFAYYGLRSIIRKNKRRGYC